MASLLGDIFSTAGAFSDDTTDNRITGLVQDDSQRGQFRTKHLRQITATGPYTHLGDLTTLRDVIALYNAGGGTPAVGTLDPVMVPLNLSEAEIDDLIAFLGTTTGEPIAATLLEDTSR